MVLPIASSEVKVLVISVQFSRSVVSDSLRPRIAAHQASLLLLLSRFSRVQLCATP